MTGPQQEKENADRVLNEADFVRVIKRALNESGLHIDTTDDCGLAPRSTEIVTTDSLVEDAHFNRKFDRPYDIGRQAAVVNLSDLAASGAAPAWVSWTLNLNRQWSLDDVYELTQGMASELRLHQTQLITGNLALKPGPSVISVTAAGYLIGEKPLLRTAAVPGDDVLISGCLGRATRGYLSPTDAFRTARHQWRPHLAEAAILAKTDGVHACMDISDGLLLDASRMAAASGVKIKLQSSLIPVIGDLSTAITGGEDYVLLFTASAQTPLPDWALRIGSCVPGHGVYLDGHPVDGQGYDHFLRGTN
ncbi:MAG: AIR synthase related protein [Myxococcota bacterium]|nr:AIR synthase related protein [Myxococcota bacterium]